MLRCYGATVLVSVLSLSLSLQEVTRMRQRVAAASGPASPKRPSISAPSPAYGEYYDYSTITKLYS